MKKILISLAIIVLSASQLSADTWCDNHREVRSEVRLIPWCVDVVETDALGRPVEFSFAIRSEMLPSEIDRTIANLKCSDLAEYLKATMDTLRWYSTGVRGNNGGADALILANVGLVRSNGYTIWAKRWITIICRSQSNCEMVNLLAHNRWLQRNQLNLRVPSLEHQDKFWTFLAFDVRELEEFGEPRDVVEIIYDNPPTTTSANLTNSP